MLPAKVLRPVLEPPRVRVLLPELTAVNARLGVIVKVLAALVALLLIEIAPVVPASSTARLARTTGALVLAPSEKSAVAVVAPSFNRFVLLAPSARLFMVSDEFEPALLDTQMVPE